MKGLLILIKSYKNKFVKNDIWPSFGACEAEKGPEIMKMALFQISIQ